jgi:hypothetical protein
MSNIHRRQFLGTTVAALAAASQGSLPLECRAAWPTAMGLPTIPYGAVYFRKSNPPKEDWERDYALAARDGMNCFRHWLLWSAIEVAPGKYDWDDYDRQMDLAAKYSIKTIIADILCTAPAMGFHQVSACVGGKRRRLARGTALHGRLCRGWLARLVSGQ